MNSIYGQVNFWSIIRINDELTDSLNVMALATQATRFRDQLRSFQLIDDRFRPSQSHLDAVELHHQNYTLPHVL